MKKTREIIGLGSGILLGIIWGILSTVLEEKEIIAPINFVWFIIAVVAGALLQIIFHELGHLVAGLMSGYKFSSFRIGNLTWIMEDGKIRFKRYSLKGTAGQCLMLPPENVGYDYPVILYNLGGVLMNVIVSTIILILSFCTKSGPLFLVSFVGYFFAATNGVPMKVGGVANDGMNVKCLKKEPLAMQAFDCQLRCNALLMKGIRLKDMPGNWFEIPEDSDPDNMNTGTMVYMQIGRMIDEHEFCQAKEKILWALENVSGMLGLYQNELKCELMFCHIMLGETEEAEKLYEYEMKKYIQTTVTWPSRKRLMYAYYLLVEKNNAMAEKELKLFNRTKKTYPYKADIESEEELIEIVTKNISLCT